MISLIEDTVTAFTDALGKVLRAELEAALAKIRAITGDTELEIARCRLLSKAQVREALNCSMRSVDNWMKDGSLPVVWLDRRPRFDPDDVRAFAQGRKLRAIPRRGRRAA
jgi:hypothetical protein